MIVAYHHHSPVVSKGNGLFVASLHGVYLEELARHCDLLYLFLYEQTKDESFFDYEIKATNIKWISIGRYSSTLRRYLLVHNVYNRINSVTFDAILFRSPTPLFPILAPMLKRRTNVATLLVGDYVRSASGLRGPFLKVFLIRIWSYVYSYFQRQVCKKNCLVLPNNILLFEEYGHCSNVDLVQTVNVSERFKFKRHDTCREGTIRILYCGRIDLDKGLLEIIEAIEMFNRYSTDRVAKFSLAGWDDSGGRNLAAIKAYVKTHSIEPFVEYLGKLSVGDELYAKYRESDIFYIGSKSSEGFPRVIWEAMLNSMPVITSKVGGIPYYVDDSCVFFLESVSAQKIFEMLVQIVENRAVRMAKIKAGFEKAKDVTLEVQAGNVMGYIRNFVMKDENC